MAGGDLEIVMFDVRHGLCLFASLPNDRTIMFDAGASEDFSPVDWLRENYGLQRLDGFIVSHPHADHVREVGRVHTELKPRVLMRNRSIPPPVLYPNGPPTTDPLKAYDTMDRAYTGECPPEFKFDNPANWGGVQIRTFSNRAPAHQFANVNDYSIVTIMDFGGLKYLFPGDLEAAGWQALMARDDFRHACISATSQIRVLVGSHHGHTRGIYDSFLKLYQPHVTIISAAHGDEHTDANAYRNASSGYWVFSSADQQFRECKVLTTKMNDYVLTWLDSANNNVKLVV